MKKNTIKAFTLVEMLIVIVIIGILIASLMPRMQTAQGRARDVARKNDLSQIQTAIITSQTDRGQWPGMEIQTAADRPNKKGIAVSVIADKLLEAGMSEVPSDPNLSNQVNGLGTTTNITGGQYEYMVATRNGVPDAGFVLMAKTEVEGSSNWVVCSGANTLEKGLIKETEDLANVKLCKRITKGECKNDLTGGECGFSQAAELRYILLY